LAPFLSASAKYFQRSEISSADVDVEPAYDGAMIERWGELAEQLGEIELTATQV